MNFSALSLGSPACHTLRFDYIDSLLLETLAPLVIFL